MNSRWMLCSAALLCALVATGCGCGGGSEASTIADYNGQKISRDEYLKRLETLSTVTVTINGQTVSAQLAEPLSIQAMRSLLTERALLEAASEEKVLPTEQEIEKEKKDRSTMQANFLTKLQEAGLSKDDIDKLLMVDLAREKLLTQGVEPKTIEEVEKFIKDNPQQFITPATVTFRWIVVSTPQKKAEVDKDLAAGIPFPDVAAKYSEAPNASITKGAFPVESREPRPVPIKSLQADLLKLIEGTEQNRRSAWKTIGNRHVMVYVMSKTKEEQRKLLEIEKEYLRRQLTMQEGQAAIDLDKLVLDRLLKAKIMIVPPYLKKAWEEYKSRLEQQVREREQPGSTGQAGNAGNTGAESGTQGGNN